MEAGGGGAAANDVVAEQDAGDHGGQLQIDAAAVPVGEHGAGAEELQHGVEGGHRHDDDADQAAPPLLPKPAVEMQLLDLEGDEDEDHAAADENQGQLGGLAEVAVQDDQAVAVEGQGQLGGLVEVAVQNKQAVGAQELDGGEDDEVAVQNEQAVGAQELDGGEDDEVAVQNEQAVGVQELDGGEDDEGQLRDDDDDRHPLLLRQPAPATPPAQINLPLGDGDDEADQHLLLPPAQVTLKLLLGGLTLTILGVIMVADLGIHPSKWADKVNAKTCKDWLLAGFVAAGSVSSLLMSYSRLPIYIGMWREGAADTLARVVPSVASLLNCLVWVSYGCLLHPANVAMILVNLTGAAFHTMYISVFIVYAETQNRMRVLIMLLLAAGAGAVIAAVDLHGSHGMELADAVGLSAVTTACMMYCMPLLLLAGQVLLSDTTAAVPNTMVLGATSLNGLVWLVDGFVVHSDRLKVAHGAGVLSCLVQAAIYLWCSKINSRKAARSTSSIARTPPFHEPLLEV